MNFCISFFLFLLLKFLFLTCSFAGYEEKFPVEFQEFIEKSSHNDKVSIVFLRAKDCHMCHYLHEKWLKKPGVIKYTSRTNFFDAEIQYKKENRPLASFFNIETTPCFVFLNKSLDVLFHVYSEPELKVFASVLEKSEEILKKLPAKPLDWNTLPMDPWVKKSAKDNHPVLIYFRDDLGGEIHDWESKVFGDREIRSKLRQFHRIKVSTDCNYDLNFLKEKDIESFPQFRVYDSYGELIAELSGKSSEDEVLGILNNAIFDVRYKPRFILHKFSYANYEPIVLVSVRKKRKRYGVGDSILGRKILHIDPKEEYMIIQVDEKQQAYVDISLDDQTFALIGDPEPLESEF